jgi:hypothetical protein
MRALIVLALAASAVGCTRWSMDHHLNNAYRAYDRGDCDGHARVVAGRPHQPHGRSSTPKCRCCAASAWSARRCTWMRRRPTST